ncbi:hypothetical protein AVEN_113587-1 [Araneus ventricosus]|uniref:Laminin G domain-containing protein n=1 Tax=Araneus ventricosus TaxID=182803 RepID=A0A4Y2JF68_ARAVE|nr:hypothetical protein AVEN_113587-1 [Araneus ventricosus]
MERNRRRIFLAAVVRFDLCFPQQAVRRGLLFFAADLGLHGTGTPEDSPARLACWEDCGPHQASAPHRREGGATQGEEFDDNQWHKIAIHRKVRERPPSEATFTGEEYLHFDVRGSGGEPLVSWSDQVSLQFRSRQSAGLLFFAADLGLHGTGTEDFLHVSLKGGGIAVHTKLGSGHVEKVVRPSKVRFDDNQWHKIVIHRKVREVSPAQPFPYSDYGSTLSTTDTGSPFPHDYCDRQKPIIRDSSTPLKWRGSTPRHAIF